MSFDERAIEHSFKSLEKTSLRIKQLANQFLFFREEHSKRLIELWKKHFFNSDIERKMNLIYVVHEILINSSQKNKIDYIKGFGDSLIEIFEDLIS